MVLHRLSRWTKALLRTEARAGFLTIASALVATVWLNSPWGTSYSAFTHTVITVGPVSLDIHKWAADFLLAFFFFIIGIELRHELTSGSLNTLRTAIVPIAGALGGILVPAAIFLLANEGLPTASGWAIPSATDIAFALAVLSLIAPQAPPALRAFLLTLAVFDDLGAILIIAIAYTNEVNFVALVWAAVLLGFVALVQKSTFAHPLLLGLMGLTVWYLIYSSGVHATIAGVALGLVMGSNGSRSHDIGRRAMDFFHPFASYVAVPLFVLVSSAVPLSVFTADVVRSPLFLGIVVGFLVGKPVGVVLFVWLVERLFGGQRAATLPWRNIYLVGSVASIGFTVALLINDLAFEDESTLSTGVAAIAVAALLGGLLSVIAARISRH